MRIIVGEIVGAEEIRAIVSRSTGIPLEKLGQSDRKRLLSLAEQLHKRVIGQANHKLTLLCEYKVQILTLRRGGE